MINIRHVPVVKVLIPFALGSLLTYTGFIEADIRKVLFLSLAICLGSFLSYRLSGRAPRLYYRLYHRLCNWMFSPSIFLLFLLAGLGAGIMDRPVDPGMPGREQVVLEGRIGDEPRTKSGRTVFGVELCMAWVADSVYQHPCLVKVYIDETSLPVVPEVGEVWILSGFLLPIQNAGNPGEIDYASILQRKNCWYRLYCDTISGINRKVRDARGRIPGPGELRRALSSTWDGPVETTALLKALCLGDRSGLSENMRENYSLAGGMHVLAVSGLHVGLIWWVLNGFFSLFLHGRRKVYRAFLVIVILWAYAYLTGFSSSVSRSVTMFSFYAFSRILSHRGHSVNAILVSMFLLILIHPGRLLDVGFQLSYAAIFSIVTLNPLISGIWHPDRRLIRWCWEATGLSFSAQLGTLPLVIYYFHQVPVYALITNLFAIPLLSFIITVFVISAPLVLAGLCISFANTVLMFAGGVLNLLMEMLANFPGSALRGLYMDQLTAIMLLILICLIILYLNNKHRLLLYLSLFSCCVIGCWLSAERLTLAESAEAQISHFRGGSLLTIREGLMADHYILSEDPASVTWMDRHMEVAWGAACIENAVMVLSERVEGDPIPGGISSALCVGPGKWMLGNSHLRILLLSGFAGGEEMELLSGFDFDILLLSNEPYIFKGDIPFKFRNIVVDGSSRGWYSGKLEKGERCFYNTASQGAFLLHY